MVLTHHMAAKKKTNASASIEPPTSTDNAIVTTNNAGNSEDALVDHLADGEFEVELHDMGISTEGIQAMRRIEVCLVEWSHNA